MNRLENSFFRFTCNPDQGSFSFQPNVRSFPMLEGVRLAVRYVYNGQRFLSLADHWQPYGVKTDYVSSAHGLLQTVQFQIGPDPRGILFELVFALEPNSPLLMWRLAIRNPTTQALWVEKIEMLRVGTEVVHSAEPGKLLSSQTVGENDLTFFSNGWQSWSFSGTYSADQKQRSSILSFIPNAFNMNPATPLPREAGHFSSDFFGVLGDRKHRSGLLAGFLSQKRHFGSLETWLQDSISLGMWANGDNTMISPDGEMQTDWAVLMAFSLDELDPLKPYLEAVRREYSVRRMTEPVAGWCSWYQYYEQVTAADVRRNEQQIGEWQNRLPLQLVQIDDGFEPMVGDWKEYQSTFPQGMGWMAGEIKKNGLRPGIWLAPFLVDLRAQNFPSLFPYLLKDQRGHPVRAAYMRNHFMHTLDVSHPIGLQMASDVVRMAVQDWEYAYLKLDFLYAAALNGERTDTSRTRAQILRGALEAFRQAAGEQTFLLGCGVPLGSAIGLMDGVRIGADTADNWLPKQSGFKFLFKKEPNLPCAANAMQNTLTRAMLHKRWWLNDPDCLLLRRGTSFSLAEIQSQATAMALTSGVFLLSDNLAEVPPERVKIAEALLPPLNQQAMVLDWMDATTPQRLRLDMKGSVGAWSLLACFNWSDSPQAMQIMPREYGLADMPYWSRSFWSQETRRLAAGEGWKQTVAPHGVLLLAVRPAVDGVVQYLGSDLHVSQGLEVGDFQSQGNESIVRLSLPRFCEGNMEFSMPAEPMRVMMEGQPIPYQSLGDGRYRLQVRFNRSAVMRIQFH